MADLSPEGEDLVYAGRKADVPTETDRERVRRALEARLGVAIGAVAAEHAANAPGGTRPGPAEAIRAAVQPVMSRWIAIGAAGVAGAALFFALRSPHRETTASRGPAKAPETALTAAGAVATAGPAASFGPADAPPQNALVQDAPLPDAPLLAAPSHDAPEAPRGPPSPPSPPSINARPAGGARAQSTLSEEVALLSHAETDLHAGRFESALRSLDEHEHRFPHGALEQERTAARAQALCALGRTAEAQGPLEQLARTAPNSPNEERARQACRNASH